MSVVWLMVSILAAVQGLLIGALFVIALLVNLMWRPSLPDTPLEKVVIVILNPHWMFVTGLVTVTLTCITGWRAFWFRSHGWFMGSALAVAATALLLRLAASWYVVHYGPIQLAGESIMPGPAHYETTLYLAALTQPSVYLAALAWVWDAFWVKREKSHKIGLAIGP
ncbi:MAG: hypothetical protein WD534_07840 [Phycisphaeraceae bacterium]